MSTGKMHEDELTINSDIVKQLINTQFPEFGDLPIKQFNSSGTDNAIFLLGDSLSIRLPLTKDAATRIDKEHHWLPQFASLLPLPIPVPKAMGTPTEDYPLHWSIYPWLQGETATVERITNPRTAATQLAEFITAMHQLDTTNGPLPGTHNFFRGVPLKTRDTEVQKALIALQGIIDTKAASRAWHLALHTPAWEGVPVWLHGDLLPTNLLVHKGTFSAIIDFGGMGIGDPACDLVSAWSLFSGENRQYFKQQLAVDETTWARGRGWALSIGLIALPYYMTTNPAFAETAAHMILQVLDDD